MLIRIFFCLMTLFIFTPPPSFALFGSSDEFSSLADLTAEMAAEIKGMIPGSKIYLDREDIRNIDDDSTSPLSSHLQRELESALGNAGFRFEGSLVDKADYRITIRYQLESDRIHLSLHLKETKDPTGSSYRTLKKKYWIASDKLSKDTLTLTVDDYLGRLVKKIIGNRTKTKHSTKLVINQTIEARKGYSSPFGEYVTQRMKTMFSSNSQFCVVEEKPTLTKVASKRSLSETGVEGTDALLSGADAVLVDTYLGSSDSLTLSATLKDQKGVVLARADESIPLHLIKHSLENDAAEQTALIADTEHENGSDLITIRTTKGGGKHQYFKEGETVQFAVKVAKTLYIYIYDINPKGEVALLYPREGETEHPLTPDLLFTIPEMSDSWEIKVEPPFGTDAVKLFASSRKLPIPKFDNKISSRSFQSGIRALARQEKLQHELAEQKRINGRDLVDYYKGIAKNLKAPLYESTVFIETRGK